MKCRILLRYGLALLLIGAMGAQAWSQPLSPPFCNKFPMDVLCPQSLGADIPNVDGFVHLARWRNKVFATFRSHPRGLGIMVLDGKTLCVESVHWPFPPGEKCGDLQWRGLASSDSQGVVALCTECEQRTTRSTYLVTWPCLGKKAHWKCHPITLKEEPTAVAWIGGEAVLGIMTKPSNGFIRYNLETGEKTTWNDIFTFVPYQYPWTNFLYSSGDGEVFGSYKGRLFCYYDSTRFFEYLGRLPCDEGHLSAVTLAAMASDQKGLFVGGTGGDGLLFTLDAESREIKPWGKPSDCLKIKKIVYVGESEFWGLAESPGQACRLFRFQPRQRMLQDMGIPAGRLKYEERTWPWHAFNVADMLVLEDGRILLAEAAKQAKFLLFDPKNKQ